MVITNILIESDTLTRIMHPDKNVTPHKIRRMEPGMTLDKEDREPESLCYWLQGWSELYTYW